MKAVIYARYSTDNQNPDTIEVQVDKCAEYAAEHDIEIVDIFADEAVSGMKSQRPELTRFFTCVERKQFDTVLIYDQSRFSRDIVDWFSFRRVIQNNDIRLISVTQQFVGGDLNDPAVFATEGINALFNQIHVLQTRQKVVEKMNYMARQGLHTGGKPALGYDVVDRKYVINDYEAQIIRCIFKMYADGKSYKDIINHLNKMEYRTKLGKPFGTNSLSDILRNERYIGVYVYNKIPPRKSGKRNSHAVSDKAIRIEGAVPRIIDRQTWEKVQKRLHDNKQNASNRAKVDYLLKGKLFCGYCGTAMTGSCSKQTYHYYTCSGKHRLKNCNKKPIGKELIEEAVVRYIKSTIDTTEKRKDLAERLYKAQEKMRANSSPVILGIHKRLQEITAKLRNINDAIAEGIYSASTGGMLRNLEQEEAKLKAQLIDEERTAYITNNTVEEIELGLKQMAGIDTSNLDGEKALISFVCRIDLYDDEFIIYTNPMDAPFEKGKRITFSKGAAPPAPAG